MRDLSSNVDRFNGTAMVFYIVSGCISAISSIAVIDIILRTRSKLASPYHIIMAFGVITLVLVVLLIGLQL